MVSPVLLSRMASFPQRVAVCFSCELLESRFLTIVSARSSNSNRLSSSASLRRGQPEFLAIVLVSTAAANCGGIGNRLLSLLQSLEECPISRTGWYPLPPES